MASLTPPRRLLKSGAITLDLDRVSLVRNGIATPINGLPLRILTILMATPDRVVTRAELKATIWPNSERIDTEHRLNTAMRALRTLLDESAESPRYIETIRGHGYRWISAPVQARRGPRWLKPTIAACLLALVSAPWTAWSPAPSAPLSFEQRDRFVRIVAQQDRAPGAAIAALDALIAERPDYRAAQVLRAEMSVRRWRRAPSAQTLAEAKAAVNLALRAVGEGADTDTLKADLALGGDWDWGGAERYYRRALARDPGNVDARHGLAWLLLNSGRRREALAEVETLLADTSLTADLRADLGWLTLRMQRADLALALCDRPAERLPNLLACRHTALARQGSIAAARAAALDFMKAVDANPDAVASVSAVPADTGYQRFLLWRSEHFVPDRGHWFQRAQVQADAGRLEEALSNLERAAANRDPALVKLASTPEFAALSATPRFRALWRAVGPDGSQSSSGPPLNLAL